MEHDLKVDIALCVAGLMLILAYEMISPTNTRVAADKMRDTCCNSGFDAARSTVYFSDGESFAFTWNCVEKIDPNFLDNYTQEMNSFIYNKNLLNNKLVSSVTSRFWNCEKGSWYK